MFDDRIGKDLGLQADVLQRLRDVDGRYQKDYTALGNEAAKNPGYGKLSDQRNAEVKGLLTPEQYMRWEKMQNGNRGKMDRGTEGTGTDGMKDGKKTTPAPTTKEKTTP